MGTFRACRTLSFAACTLMLGCIPKVHMDVYTLSDRPPSADATYFLELGEAQAGDLEATRLASRIDAEMARAGYRKVDSAAAAELNVRFDYSDDGLVESERPTGQVGATTSRTTTTSSGTSIAGVPVPLTRRSSVSRQHGASFGSPVETDRRLERRYGLELSFMDEAGPVHKVTVSASSGDLEWHELAPCLVAAAFQDFPSGDRQTRRVSLDLETCRAG